MDIDALPGKTEGDADRARPHQANYFEREGVEMSKEDPIGAEIRKRAKQAGLGWEIEIIPHFSGAKVRIWRLIQDRWGRAPVGFIGSQTDEETLRFLRLKK